MNRKKPARRTGAGELFQTLKKLGGYGGRFRPYTMVWSVAVIVATRFGQRPPPGNNADGLWSDPTGGEIFIAKAEFTDIDDQTGDFQSGDWTHGLLR